MGLWSAYFLVKLLLYARGDIPFDVWPNLAFAAFTALRPGNARQRLAKNLIAVPVGVLLMYHDSWMPPVTDVIGSRAAQGVVHPALWAPFHRPLDWMLPVEIVLLLSVYAILRRKVRVSTFVFIGIAAVAAFPLSRLTTPAPPAIASAVAAPRVSAPVHAEPPDLSSQALEAQLTRFYAAQDALQVHFTRAAADATPFDILVLNVSSLSWDDLDFVHQDRAALLDKFDVVLSRFNSAASFDREATLRWLRSACGQTPERQLAEPASRECLVIDGLRQAGFEPRRLDNHGDGDYVTLSNWWARRSADHAPRVVLYYNMMSLLEDDRVAGPVNDTAYGARVSRLRADVNRFLDDVRRSGRHAVVLFLGEHGAALRGDRRQVSGLREIPTPAIANVPVGIALINAGRPLQSPQLRIDEPTSYRAVNELLARFVADNPFEHPDLDLHTYVEGLPQTEFVAENDGNTVIQVGGYAMMRSPDGTWSSLDTSTELARSMY